VEECRYEEMLPLLKLQPGIITNNRLGGGFGGDSDTPEQEIPATGLPGRDWETCMTMNDTWGYKSYDNNFKSTETLVRNLVDIASKGGNYLLNVGPTAEGLIPQPSVERLREIGTQAAVLMPAGGGVDESVLAFTGRLELTGLRIEAEMGLVSRSRLTLAGCRELAVDERKLVSSPQGLACGWDLTRNGFESGKAGFGLEPGAAPDALQEAQPAVAAAVEAALRHAVRLPAFTPPEVAEPSEADIPELADVERLTLRTPVSLATGDLDGDGAEEPLLYDDQGQPRFPYPEFVGGPTTVDFGGDGRPHIAFALPRRVEVYRQDGALEFGRDLDATGYTVSAGRLDADHGPQQLGVVIFNWALVLDGQGREVISEPIAGGAGLGAAFGDVDGDGREEYVIVTQSGPIVARPEGAQPLIAWQSYLAGRPVRLWLRDLDGDGVPEAYVGGGGTDVACYDLRERKCRWSLSNPPVHPRDAALLDVDGDGRPEIISGGADGFLLVSDADGRYRWTRSVGVAIESLLATLAGDLLVGLSDGRVLLLSADLRPLAQARVGGGPCPPLGGLCRPGRQARTHGRRRHGPGDPLVALPLTAGRRRPRQEPSPARGPRKASTPWSGCGSPATRSRTTWSDWRCSCWPTTWATSCGASSYPRKWAIGA